VFKFLLKAMRPKQWAKNVFVFAGLFFDAKAFQLQPLLKSCIAFATFCLVSSAIYLINDLVDVEKDRLHPVKKLRPIASGTLPPLTAQVAAGVILAVTIPAAFLLDATFGLAAIVYATLMIVYSFVLKKIVIIDVMTVAAGFVLRVFAGSAVVQVARFSPWLYVCTTLLALFIAINRRRNELVVLADCANSHRASLEEYNLPLLDDMNSLVTSATLVSYSFYTFSAPNTPGNHAMMLTIPFVVYGIFRYLYLLRVKNLGGAPEEILLGDRPFLISLLLWALTAAIVIYSPIMPD